MLVTMSQKELNRIPVLQQVCDKLTPDTISCSQTAEPQRSSAPASSCQIFVRRWTVLLASLRVNAVNPQTTAPQMISGCKF